MKKYSHLSIEEREKIYLLRNQGLSFRSIGEVLGRHHSTISAEWWGNTKYFQEYSPSKAQSRYEKRAIKQRSKAPLKNVKVFLYVRERLRKGWSPELIAGRLTIDHPNESIHHETIYRYIYNSKYTRGEYLWRYLTKHRRRRMKKNGRKVKGVKILNRVSIEQRPIEADLRSEVGHWETDLMEGKRSDKKVVSVNVDRKTRFITLDVLPGKDSKTKMLSIVESLKNLPVKSITTDNGPENKKHYLINKPVYFCNPYHSWEKGSVENAIGRVRKYIPKGTSLSGYKQTDLKEIEYEMNNTPRKCLDYATPYEKIVALSNSPSG